jgi:hypothetical protein
MRCQLAWALIILNVIYVCYGSSARELIRKNLGPLKIWDPKNLNVIFECYKPSFGSSAHPHN